jgi:hypothetical protein
MPLSAPVPRNLQPTEHPAPPAQGNPYTFSAPSAVPTPTYGDNRSAGIGRVKPMTNPFLPVSAAQVASFTGGMTPVPAQQQTGFTGPPSLSQQTTFARELGAPRPPMYDAVPAQPSAVTQPSPSPVSAAQTTAMPSPPPLTGHWDTGTGAWRGSGAAPSTAGIFDQSGYWTGQWNQGRVPTGHGPFDPYHGEWLGGKAPYEGAMAWNRGQLAPMNRRAIVGKPMKGG